MAALSSVVQLVALAGSLNMCMQGVRIVGVVRRLARPLLLPLHHQEHHHDDDQCHEQPNAFDRPGALLAVFVRL